MPESHKHYRTSRALPDGHRQCTKCLAVLPYESFHKHSRCHGGYNSVCKKCRQPVSRKNHANTPREKRLWNAAKSRANKKGREFSIELSDVVIPALCPVLGIPMDRPSLDRIDGTKGYVKGNVRVISHRANMLKNNATIEELTLVLRDLKRRK